MNQATKVELKGVLSDAEIAALKAKYPGGIYSITVDDMIGYYKNPTRLDVQCALAKQDADSPLESCFELAEITLIGGTDLLAHGEDVALGLVPFMRTKMNGKIGTLVNL